MNPPGANAGSALISWYRAHKPRLRCPLPEPRVRGRELVIYHRRDSGGGLSKQQGLFAEFFSVLGALRFAERRGAAAVRPCFNSSLYLDLARGPNWWEYFFTAPLPVSGVASHQRAVHCRGQHRYGPYWWNDSWIAEITPRNSYLKPYPVDSPEELAEAARLTAAYIRVQPELAAEVETRWRTHVAPGEFVIGLHLRGTDKVESYPHRSPSFATYLAQVERIRQAHNAGPCRIFVATDQADYAVAARAAFGSRCFMVDDAPRLPAGDAAARELGTHKHPAFSPRARGHAAVLDCLLLARCTYLVKNRSALSDAALAFNPQLPWTFILGDDEVYLGASADRSRLPCG